MTYQVLGSPVEMKTPHGVCASDQRQSDQSSSGIARVWNGEFILYFTIMTPATSIARNSNVAHWAERGGQLLRRLDRRPEARLEWTATSGLHHVRDAVGGATRVG